MRKLFLLFILLFTTTIYGQDCTNLVVNMYDSYGDGWNGNTLSVGDNSVTLANGSEGIDTSRLLNNALKKLYAFI